MTEPLKGNSYLYSNINPSPMLVDTNVEQTGDRFSSLLKDIKTSDTVKNNNIQAYYTPILKEFLNTVFNAMNKMVSETDTRISINNNMVVVSDSQYKLLETMANTSTMYSKNMSKLADILYDLQNYMTEAITAAIQLEKQKEADSVKNAGIWSIITGVVEVVFAFVSIATSTINPLSILLTLYLFSDGVTKMTGGIKEMNSQNINNKDEQNLAINGLAGAIAGDDIDKGNQINTIFSIAMSVVSLGQVGLEAKMAQTMSERVIVSIMALNTLMSFAGNLLNTINPNLDQWAKSLNGGIIGVVNEILMQPTGLRDVLKDKLGEYEGLVEVMLNIGANILLFSMFAKMSNKSQPIQQQQEFKRIQNSIRSNMLFLTKIMQAFGVSQSMSQSIAQYMQAKINTALNNESANETFKKESYELTQSTINMMNKQYLAFFENSLNKSAQISQSYTQYIESLFDYLNTVQSTNEVFQ